MFFGLLSLSELVKGGFHYRVRKDFLPICFQLHENVAFWEICARHILI